MALAHTQALAARLQLPELLDCVATDWRVTDCFFGGSFDTPFDDKLRLDRAYLRWTARCSRLRCRSGTRRAACS